MRAGSIYSPPEHGKRNPIAAGDREKRERREGGEGEPLCGWRGRRPRPGEEKKWAGRWERNID